jgi:TPR repeat protein
MRLLLALTLTFLRVPASAAVPAADDAWAKGDYRQAFALAIERANKGDAHAQFLIGEAYRLGRSVDPNFPQAEQWYARAARQGDIAAAAELGLLLASQHLESAALPWLMIAAQHGEPRALCSLAAIYFNGDSVARDEVRAFALMSRAAATGLPEAQARLATLRAVLPADTQARGTALAANLVIVPALQPAKPPAETAPVPTRRPPPVRIQVGAYRSAEAAEQAWAQLNSRIAGPIRADHAVERAGPVYRLQARLTDRTAAEAFRRRLASAGWDYFTRQAD